MSEAFLSNSVQNHSALNWEFIATMTNSSTDLIVDAPTALDDYLMITAICRLNRTFTPPSSSYSETRLIYTYGSSPSSSGEISSSYASIKNSSLSPGQYYSTIYTRLKSTGYENGVLTTETNFRGFSAGYCKPGNRFALIGYISHSSAYPYEGSTGEFQVDFYGIKDNNRPWP